MSFISFNHSDLQKIDLFFEKEYLEANKTGAYSSSSVVNCNTRKYHGLFVVRQPQLDTQSYVLLNSLDETIFLKDKTYQLGVHQYPGIIEPKGYLHLESFSLEKIPTWIYKVENSILKKELLLCKNENRLLIKYSLNKESQELKLRLDPFVSFRKIHQLNKYNTYVNSWMTEEEHGVSYQMYSNFDSLYFQSSKDSGFTPQIDWFFNLEYHRELERGYDFKEDLLRIGHFDLTLKPGKEVVFSVGISAIDPDNIEKLFIKEVNNRSTQNNLEEYLLKAADQFITEEKKSAEVCAGFHWFGRWGRDTFIALPGLTLSTNQPELCKKVMDTMLGDLRNGLLTNIGVGNVAEYNSADASLWFFWSLQAYTLHTNSISTIWDSYGDKIQNILNNYRRGTHYNIQMLGNGLLNSGEDGVALTWMDAKVDGTPVTQRPGKTVDLNALWYNAICFALEAAKANSSEAASEFVELWEEIPVKIKQAFDQEFWDDEKAYLADFINKNEKDWSFRPNQIFAISLPFPLIEGKKAELILQKVKEKLLTPRGLRTLSPDDEKFQYLYRGTQKQRDNMYHQGIVWPWLLGHFVDAYVKTFPAEGKLLAKEIFDNFEQSITEYGLGSVAEIYDAMSPHKAVGTISQAWSVSELLRINNMIKSL